MLKVCIRKQSILFKRVIVTDSMDWTARGFYNTTLIRLRVLRGPFACTVKGFTKDTKEGTKDTKQIFKRISRAIVVLYRISRISTD
jgi:hypothetical protein